MNRKIKLFGMLLTGQSDEDIEADGFCYRERSEMRAYLVLHGYLDEVHGSHSREASPFEAQTHRFQMTPNGASFLAQLSRRMA
jgi:hypothetical protein